MPLIKVYGTTPPYYEKVKNLSLTLNRTLSWFEAVVEISIKVFAGIQSLKRSQHFLTIDIKLFKAFILHFFDYRHSLINDLTVTFVEKLQGSQSYCVNFIFYTRRDDHIMLYFIRYNNFKFADIRSLKMLSILAHQYCGFLITAPLFFISLLQLWFVAFGIHYPQNIFIADDWNKKVPRGHNYASLNKGFSLYSFGLIKEQFSLYLYILNKVMSPVK